MAVIIRFDRGAGELGEERELDGGKRRPAIGDEPIAAGPDRRRPDAVERDAERGRGAPGRLSGAANRGALRRRTNAAQAVAGLCAAGAAKQ